MIGWIQRMPLSLDPPIAQAKRQIDDELHARLHVAYELARQGEPR